jgi:anti-anti-sigma regulatory factor
MATNRRGAFDGHADPSATINDMSWQIKHNGSTDVVVLGGEMCIQNAAEFHQTVIPLAGSGKALRIDAAACKSIHTSIMQILYALSRATLDFAVVNASDEFRSTEVRVGISFARSQEPATGLDGTEKEEAIRG